RVNGAVSGIHGWVGALASFLVVDTPAPEFYSVPYTTLFRSPPSVRISSITARPSPCAEPPWICPTTACGLSALPTSCTQSSATRSEEHTSELQSRENLVCRLLLEKKKKKTYIQKQVGTDIIL